MLHRLVSSVTLLCCTLIIPILASAAAPSPLSYVSSVTYWQSPGAGTGFPAGFRRTGYSMIHFPQSGYSIPGSIVLIGGLDASGAVVNDVWKSSDEGASWTQTSTDFPGRYQAAACEIPGSDIVVVGGFTKDKQPANDVYRGTNYGAMWARLSQSLPFATAENPSCTMDGGQIHLFVWVGGSEFNSNTIQLWRASYLNQAFVEWIAISISSEGRSIDSRSLYAVQFVLDGVYTKIIIGGGYRSGENEIVKEVLLAVLPNVETQNTTTWTVAPVNANWPSSSLPSSFVWTTHGDFIMYTPSNSSSSQPNFWVAAAITYNVWIPVNQNSSCVVEWNPDWVGVVSQILPSYSDQTKRLLLLNDLSKPTLMMTVGVLQPSATATISAEGFTPIDDCAPPAPSDSGRVDWRILVGIGAGSAVVIACMTFLLCNPRRRKEVDINSPLLP